MPRYKITLEYLGTNFSGWQKQKNSYTVQEAVELAARKLLQQKIGFNCSRQDRLRVHAEGQVAHFDIKNLSVQERCSWELIFTY